MNFLNSPGALILQKLGVGGFGPQPQQPTPQINDLNGPGVTMANGAEQAQLAQQMQQSMGMTPPEAPAFPGQNKQGGLGSFLMKMFGGGR